MSIEELKQAVKDACQKLFNADVKLEVTRPNEQFGDYATNAALQLAKELGKSPRELADRLAAELSGIPNISEATVAGPGFINFRLTDEALARAAFCATDLPRPLSGQEILVEFGDPNPFKEMHIGHAYSYITGDAIASLLEAAGAKVHRLSYHGDVGLHVAKTIWAIKYKETTATQFHRGEVTTDTMMGAYYAVGNKAYEEHKAEIDEINRQIYDGDNSKINELYEWGKAKSFEYFDKILKDLEVHPAERFLESQSAKTGKEIVEQHPEVFEKSDGAVVYKGEKGGLHTRVFITSAGLPTYEAKDLGLAELKQAAYPGSKRSIVITAHEQAEYFKVMLAALGEFDPDIANKTTHLYHGFVSLSSGKMSSRTGNVYSALNLIIDVDEAVKRAFKTKSAPTRNAAIKYGFLKHRLGSDIIYDISESVSLEGNSGPYLQYAHARACSILAKADFQGLTLEITEFGGTERSLARKISEYPEVVEKAVNDLMPHHICTYLYELAQAFNSFYEKNRVISDERQNQRLKLVNAYQKVLKNGLGILNIEALERI